jgi:hypothetical protein
MPQNITCFACEEEPTQQCRRCGRPYCDDHGEEVCDACLEPASALPSLTLYRGSLLALLVGTFVAVWLILQPPGDGASSAIAPQVITPTEPAAVQTTPTVPAGAPTATTPSTQGTPPSSSPTTPPAENTPAASGTTVYTVQSGDTIGAICANLSSLDPSECVDRVLELNSITDPASISVGETLVIPQ